jgi:hypothetical protein
MLNYQRVTYGNLLDIPFFPLMDFAVIIPSKTKGGMLILPPVLMEFCISVRVNKEHLAREQKRKTMDGSMFTLPG